MISPTLHILPLKSNFFPTASNGRLTFDKQPLANIRENDFPIRRKKMQKNAKYLLFCIANSFLFRIFAVQTKLLT